MGQRQRVQRVAAYAVIVRGDQILLSRLSERVTRHELWSLPGGGIDHGEDPRDAVVREVYEETGLHAEPGRLVDVHSTHFTGARPDGVVEDYHGIGLIFEAELLPESRESEPYVVDVGGSTDLARWFAVGEARELARTGALSGSAKLALSLIDRTAEHGASADVENQ